MSQFQVQHSGQKSGKVSDFAKNAGEAKNDFRPLCTKLPILEDDEQLTCLMCVPLCPVSTPFCISDTFSTFRLLLGLAGADIRCIQKW